MLKLNSVILKKVQISSRAAKSCLFRDFRSHASISCSTPRSGFQTLQPLNCVEESIPESVISIGQLENLSASVCINENQQTFELVQANLQELRKLQKQVLKLEQLALKIDPFIETLLKKQRVLIL